MLTSIAQKYLSKALFIFWLAVTSPPLLLLGWLRQSYPDLREELSGLGILLVLVWLFGSYWLGATTAHHMFNENRMFLTAVKHTIYDLKFRLAFLPLVGGWFMADENDEDNTKHEALMPLKNLKIQNAAY